MIGPPLRTGTIPRLAPIPVSTTVNKERARLNLKHELGKTVALLGRDSDPGMTFWSRYDPVAQPKGNTDHWTKMKQRAVQFRSLDNPDSIGIPITLGPHFTRSPYGRVQQLRDMTFDDFVVDALQGAIPGNYMYTRPRNTVSRESVKNVFNDRAREGFRYWLIERPKPTSFGKYGIGSYKTVLGVGNAPRT